MTLGILEPTSRDGFPPGTVHLEELHDHNTGGDAILVPTPSNLPRDPLNMSKVRKELYFSALIFGACTTGVIGPVLVPGFSIVAVAFSIDLGQVALLNGALVMALGVSAYLCAPLAALYGRRIVYLLTTLIMLFGCVWAGYASSYDSLLGSRIVQGLGMGGFFALAGTASINDVFFVHQRGRRAGLWNFSVIVCVNVAPVISGYLITGLGWQWSFRILAIAFAVAFLLVFFFMPETLFHRQHPDGIDPVVITPRMLPDNGEVVEKSDKYTQDATVETPSSSLSAVGTSHEASPAWKRFLGLEDMNYQTVAKLLPKLVGPLALLLNPIVLWACAMWSVTFSWVIILGAVADQIFEAAPFSLSPTGVGLLIGIAPLIGSALGTVAGGWLCDYVAQAMAIRNGGIYEPEFRLTVMIPSLITTGIGGFGLGIAITDGLSIWASAVFLGFINFGVGVGCTAIIAYTNDACEEKAAEAFGVAMLIKSAFAFGITFMLNEYLTAKGAAVFFSTWAGLTTGVTLTTIPLYIFGKRIRASMRIERKPLA